MSITSHLRVHHMQQNILRGQCYLPSSAYTNSQILTITMCRCDWWVWLLPPWERSPLGSEKNLVVGCKVKKAGAAQTVRKSLKINETERNQEIAKNPIRVRRRARSETATGQSGSCSAHRLGKHHGSERTEHILPSIIIVLSSNREHKLEVFYTV